ncbi:MAG: NosD domain-containing protein [Tateyamaria sp.]|uniref:NosD domain-containing protein n=1 Tax=Tateyamaria sp. TaxID=1929288 RepID=UPI00327EB33C
MSHSLRSLLTAIVVAVTPHTALGDPSAVNLSEMRATLNQINAELGDDVKTPVDVAALWTRLGRGAGVLDQAKAVTPLAAQTTPPAVNGSLFGAGRSQDAEPKDAVTPAPIGLLSPLLGTHVATPLRGVPQDVGTTNFRLMLASLAQTYTGKNNTAVVNAQGARGPVALSIQSGTVTLADIQAYSAAQGMPPLADGTMTMPVVIWPDATLRLDQGERLALARDAGAFVLAMGTLIVDRALIEAVGPENQHTPSFNPFVSVIGGGSLKMTGAILRDLGFGQTPKFSGLSVAGNLLNQTRGTVTIRDSLFDNLKGVQIAGMSGAEITGNTFGHLKDAAVTLTMAPGSSVAGNLFYGTARTNAIRVTAGSGHSQIDRNLFLDGERVAVLVDGQSDNVRVRDNVVWRRDGGGIKFSRTQCGLVAGNVILDNRQKGIEVRRSDGTVLRDNLIAGNSSAGIWVSAQARQARTALNGNILNANGAGLSTATSAEILLDNNDFSRQLPKLLDGDVGRLTHKMVADLRGSVPLRFKDGQAEHVSTDATLCGGAW